MQQHRARAVVPGAHTFLSTGEFLRPHTRCHRAKGLEGCVTNPIVFDSLPFWFREFGFA